MAQALSVAEIAQRALNSTEVQRCRLAALKDAPAELLMLLAGDAASAVREAVACNPATPSPADRLLCQDPVTQVRASLARKLGADAVALMDDALPRRRHPARDALLLLAADVDAAVRGALADALADLPDAPRELVLTLARDEVLAVCEPLLRLSAALREADMMRLVQEAPHPHVRPALARRLHVASPVAEALLATGDRVATLALLRNATARVAPAVLARLARQAPAMPWLQEDLVIHRGLPEVARDALVPRLARDVLQRLAQRTDLPAAMMQALRQCSATGMVWSG
ncbi:MAG TPA: DUF2336 domain-containing protein [Roseococcus sp.]|nr:DUF2336 domain-containing protein [Roseococcus sp.]